MQVMVDLVKRMNWTYVATLADEGNYGEKGIAEFATLAEKSGESSHFCYLIVWICKLLILIT